MILLLIFNGIKKILFDTTPLICAILEDNIEIVKILISQPNIDINKTNILNI